MRLSIYARRLGRGALLVFLAAMGASAQTVSESRTRIQDPEAEAAQKLLADAQAALDQKDYATAAQKYQAYIAKRPDDAYAHFQLGYAYTATGRPRDAKPEYAKAAELDPKMGAAYVNLGVTLMDLDEASAAVEPLEKAAELAPTDARPKFLAATALLRTGNLAGAIEQLQAAEKLDAKDVSIRTELGNALLSSNRTADAEAEYRAALALQPDSPQAHLGLARCLIAEKKPNDAAAELDSYLKSRPNDSAARIERASLLIDAGKYQDALNDLDLAAGGKPENLRALTLRAQAYLGMKNYDAAIPVLQKAAALAPRDPQFPAALGRACFQKKDYPDSIRFFVAAFNMDQTSTGVLSELIGAEYFGGNYRGALQGLDLLERRQPLSIANWFTRAACFDKLGEVAPALDAYKKFLQLNKDENSDMYFVAAARARTLQRELEEHKR